MLYLIYGDDMKKKNQALAKLLGSFKQDPIRFNDVDFNATILEEYILGSGLFEESYVVVIDRALENKDAKEFILSRLESMKTSSNIFIVSESSLTKDIVKKFEKHAEDVQEFKAEKRAKLRPEFNIFSITDAFGKRDKKNFWILYQKARSRDIPPEEIQGILFWQVKSMFLAKDKPNTADSLKKTGLKPFVFKKALDFSKNYSWEELKHISQAFTSLHHENRRVARDLGIDLEKLILEVI